MNNNTEIQLPVAELKTVLPGLNKIIGRRATLPVLGCVRVETDSEGRVNLHATDLEDYATVMLKEAKASHPGNFLVPWGPLSKAIKHSKENLALVDQGERGVLLRTVLAGSPVEQTLRAPEVNEWPPMPMVKTSGILVEAALRQALLKAFECASDNPSRVILNPAYLDVSDDKAHYVVSSNGRVLFAANSFTFDLKQSLVLPARKFLGWPGFWKDQQCRLAFQPGRQTKKIKETGWVQFKTERWTFITREIEGNYPNWRPIVPRGAPRNTIKLDADALRQMLEVLPKLPGDDEVNSPIDLVVANDHLQIEICSSSDEKTAVIPIEGAHITGKPVSIRLNRKHLVRALRFGMGDILIFDPLSPLVCQAPGKRLIIAPLQSDDDQPASPEVATSTQANNEQSNNERNEMPKTATTINAPEATSPAETPATGSAIKSVIGQIQQIRETLKQVISDFNDVLVHLKTAEKEKKATEKEIESVRATLRTIQNVKI